MKHLLLPILILLTACASVASKTTDHKGAEVKGYKIVEFSKKRLSFTIPYGLIRRGDTQAQVTKKLGNPQHVSSDGNTDIWHYHFDTDEHLFVYFIDGKVVDVKNKDVGM